MSVANAVHILQLEQKIRELEGENAKIKSQITYPVDQPYVAIHIETEEDKAGKAISLLRHLRLAAQDENLRKRIDEVIK